MKAVIGLSLLICMCVKLNAQQQLSAEDSDPKKLEWMQGFPPQEDKIISAIDGSFFRFPALRYSVCHMRQFMPTTEVQAATERQYKSYGIEINTTVKIRKLIPHPYQPMRPCLNI